MTLPCYRKELGRVQDVSGASGLSCQAWRTNVSNLDSSGRRRESGFELRGLQGTEFFGVKFRVSGATLPGPAGQPSHCASATPRWFLLG